MLDRQHEINTHRQIRRTCPCDSPKHSQDHKVWSPLSPRIDYSGDSASDNLGAVAILDTLPPQSVPDVTELAQLNMLVADLRKELIDMPEGREKDRAVADVGAMLSSSTSECAIDC